MPATIAHYNLLELIGEGGLGPVYRARDTRVGRTVALKVAPASAFADPASLDALLDAATAAAKLSHPNIATLFDVGRHEEGAYLAYEFAPGVTVREEMAGQSVAPRRTIELVVQIADALADGHASGIVHGDVRPDNIIITPKGSAKLLEFGIGPWSRAGRLRASAASAPHSLDQEAMSVISYMSPEQALGGPVDARTDVFSLGVVLYEMLTAAHPFVGAGAAATVMNIIQATVPPASPGGSGIPHEIDPILARALTKDITRRQQSAAALAAELRSVAAILDVRSGDAVDTDLLIPIDDDGMSAGTWAGIVTALAALGALIWYLAR